MEFPKCPTCNTDLSSIYEYYTHVKELVLQSMYANIDINKIKYDSQIGDSLDKVFRLVQLDPTAICCRLHLGTATIFDLDKL